MCGIIGISAKKNVSNDIVQCLKHLSYRGYDSAGLSIAKDNEIFERKIQGKVTNLENFLMDTVLQ